MTPCAGPYDLSGMVQRIGQRMSYSEPAVPAYLDMFDWFSTFLPRTKAAQNVRQNLETVQE